MEEKLLGHLLKANDLETLREIERRLAEDPTAIHDLAVLRRALMPLESAREEHNPPADLWVRTISRVAEHIVATEGRQTAGADGPTEELIRRAALLAGTPSIAPTITPASPMSDAVPIPPRRRNVVATIGLSIAVLALVIPAVVHVRQSQQRMACQNSMQSFYQAAADYSADNEGRFPQVPDGQAAASAAITLKQTGYLPTTARLACPGGNPEQAAPGTMANYAYSLGYRDKEGQLWGLDRRPENDMLPIMADAPMRQGRETFPINHSHGQNVLFAGGHVRFCTSSHVGVNQDDIFCNADGRVGAGLFPKDSALGRPEELP